MHLYATQRKVGLSISAAALAVLLLNSLNYSITYDLPLGRLLLSSGFWPIALVLIFFLISSFVDSKGLRWAQGLVFLVLSAPALMINTEMSFFGLWFLIMGVVLLFKYRFFERRVVLKAVLVGLWAFVWVTASVYSLYDPEQGRPIISLNFFIFIFASFPVLYFLFEEDIRELTRSNSAKEKELEEQRLRLARLEPLSVLGERVSHLTHSFKNNLTQVSAALYYLEKGQTAKAVERLSSFSATMVERIDNVLMLARSSDPEAVEDLDLGKLLDGIKFLFLEDPQITRYAKTELDAAPGVMVRARKGDLVLMIENLLRNAVEALMERSGLGMLRIVLRPGYLRVSNEGGPMTACKGCVRPCRDCERFLKPGYTTKRGGSGHGLYQVFSAVREHGWDIQVETSETLTSFTVFFSPRPDRTEPAPLPNGGRRAPADLAAESPGSVFS
jgi:signal transduction histidine kinase